MWIIPKNLNISHFAPDMEESTLDSREHLAERFSTSLMWRSKPSQSRTWSRRLKTTCSTWRLFSRILSVSRGSSIVEKWISSQEASLVSHLVAQDDEPETTTPDTSSRISSTVSSAWDDLPLFSSKMLRGSSAQSSKATDGVIRQVHRFCSISSESWKDWVTKRRREYSLRVKSVPPINESACLSWAVGPISGSQDGLLFQGCSSEGEKGLTWLSPATTAGDAREPLFTATGEPWTGEGRAYRANGVHRTLTLNMQVVKQWATPRAGKIDSEDLERWIERNRKNNGKTGCPLPLQVEIEAQPTPPQEAEINIVGNRPELPAKLNPRWVETLMGLPVGWTMPSCQDPWIIAPMSSDFSEMESYPTPPHEPLECYGDSLPTNSKKDKDT